MYKKTTNKDRVLSQIDFVIGEIKFAAYSAQRVPGVAEYTVPG